MKYLTDIYLRQLFKTNVLSPFINPFFFYRKKLYRSIKAYAPILSGRLLDFGCGSKPYKDLFVNATEYYGADVENPGHDHSKEDIDLYYNGKNLPLPDNSFDSVFCSEVLEHVPDLQESILEIKRVLKPNGLLLLTVPFFWMEHEKPHDYRRFTKDGIVKMLEMNNFEIIHAEKVSHFTEALFQMWSMYIYSFFANQNKYLRMIFSFLFISPVTLSGLIISLILPRKKTLYLGTCILAKNKN